MFLVVLICACTMVSEVYPNGLAKRFTSTCETIPAEVHLAKGKTLGLNRVRSMTPVLLKNIRADKCKVK
jgi:hypothetical protein